jgi:hypothetical protein
MNYILFDNSTNTDINAVAYKIMPSQGGSAIQRVHDHFAYDLPG